MFTSSNAIYFPVNFFTGSNTVVFVKNQFTTSNQIDFSVSAFTVSNSVNFGESLTVTPIHSASFAAYFDDFTGVFHVENIVPIVEASFSAVLDDFTGNFSALYALPGSIFVNFTLQFTTALTVDFPSRAPLRFASFSAQIDDFTGVFTANSYSLLSNCNFSAQLDDFTGAFTAIYATNLGNFSATLDDFTGGFNAEYDVNTHRFHEAHLCASYQDAGLLATDLLSTIPAVLPVKLQAVANYQQAVSLWHGLQAMTATIKAEAVTAVANYQSASQAVCSVNIIINAIKNTATTALVSYEQALAIQSATHANINTTAFLLSIAEVRQDVAADIYVDLNIVINRVKPLFKKLCTLVQDAIKAEKGKSITVDPVRPPATPPPNRHDIITITIPTRQVYSMIHTILIKTVIGNINIPLRSLTLSYDVDSYAWVFSAILADKDSLSAVTMTDDVPVKLSITINGYNWIVLIETIEQSRSFGELSIHLKGRSLSALLGAPYQIPFSYTVGSDKTVQQIADDLLPVGWTIDWQCADWVVPANTFSFTHQTILQAIAGIAQSIGAVVIPSRNSQTLTIQPRYPVLPWGFTGVGVVPDLVIPESALLTVNTAARTQSPINAVYVHGEVNGVLAWCRLSGTAGDVLMPTSSNALITDAYGCRALAERLLAGMATQPVISAFTMPLGGDWTLAGAGQLVDVTLGGSAERAIINGVSINAEFSKVTQSVTVGEQTTNAYSRLLSILPAQPLLVATLVSTINDVSILTLLDGGVITARGSGVVGDRYYVRNGLIESAAPNLTQVEIVI
ncbi:hypothetical protein UFOVP1367_23 [uncultured Caudovirales phage]|uniref:Uncharacterized protein n=1 Tax=uncultured Caudovirales phage TaxID=2100421 RepID=A0A6J5S2K0_9CAUD|nr:tail protein [uncultured Caudovirales phage]CAB4202557.1 hypothetical protein UFOVP1367_23 [uncultured Caudovirales phage]